MPTFDITPVAKPRMVRSDKWKKRPAVERYWLFKGALLVLAKHKKFTLKETITVTFYLPMPKGWSKKKKADMDGTTHQVRPDMDNLIKALQDCLLPEDSHVWKIQAEKRWAEKGSIHIL